MDAGVETQAKDSIMANIGTFTKSGDSYNGEIHTIGLQTKNVRIIPEDVSTNDNAPSHRVYVGRAEAGAAWRKVTREGRNYLSLKLDDPSFTAPIFASLFDDDDGKTYNLIWTRNSTANGG
jgi:uncharacterized protein (DUF736 family)